MATDYINGPAFEKSFAAWQSPEAIYWESSNSSSNKNKEISSENEQYRGEYSQNGNWNDQWNFSRNNTPTYSYSDKFLKETGSPSVCVQMRNHIFEDTWN